MLSIQTFSSRVKRKYVEKYPLLIQLFLYFTNFQDNSNFLFRVHDDTLWGSDALSREATL